MSRPRLLRQDAFTLVELAIAVGLAGALALGVSKVLTGISTTAQRTNITSEFWDERSMTQLLLKSEVDCKDRLKLASGSWFTSPPMAEDSFGVMVMSAGAHPSAVVQDGRLLKDGTLKGQRIYENARIRNITHLRDLAALPVKGGTPSPRISYLADLAVSRERPDGQGGPISFVVPLYLEIDSTGTLTACSLMAKGERALRNNWDGSPNPHTYSDCVNATPPGCLRCMGVPYESTEGAFCKVIDLDAMYVGKPAFGPPFVFGPPLKGCPDNWTQFENWSSTQLQPTFDNSIKNPPYAAIGCF